MRKVLQVNLVQEKWSQHIFNKMSKGWTEDSNRGKETQYTANGRAAKKPVELQVIETGQDFPLELTKPEIGFIINLGRSHLPYKTEAIKKKKIPFIKHIMCQAVVFQ